MTDKELWQKCVTDGLVPDCGYQAWAFGSDADALAELVIKGEKTATASGYIWYEIEKEPLPEAEEFSVVLNSKGEAVCVIKTTKVYVVPFNQVSAEHAHKEGEGDKSLAYWRNVHRAFFEDELKSVGLEFSEEMQVVCEEFELIYSVQ